MMLVKLDSEPTLVVVVSAVAKPVDYRDPNPSTVSTPPTVDSIPPGVQVYREWAVFVGDEIYGVKPSSRENAEYEAALLRWDDPRAAPGQPVRDGDSRRRRVHGMAVVDWVDSRDYRWR